MAAPKRLRQVFFGWHFVLVTAIVLAIFLVAGREIAQGDNVGEHALVLTIFGVGYVIFILLLRRMRRKEEI